MFDGNESDIFSNHYTPYIFISRVDRVVFPSSLFYNKGNRQLGSQMSTCSSFVRNSHRHGG